MTYSVVFKNVTKKYKMFQKSTDQLRGVIATKRYGKDFYALNNVSFTAEPGDVIGVVGVNGAGKSTLSNLIAGVAAETSGNILIQGNSSIISISTGMDNELSGRDNIEYKCLMLGFKKQEILELMPDIIEFADIGDFIDQPVKNYSSGMKSRLGFAISVTINPDVLVIDEALSVGDQTFKKKCHDKMNEFKEKGKTIFFVSHSLIQVRDFCDKVLWLEAGEVRAYGQRKAVLPKYRDFLKEYNTFSDKEKRDFRQNIIERRSKMKKSDDLVNAYPESVPFGELRTPRKKDHSFFLSLKVQIIILLLLIMATGIAMYIYKPWEMVLNENNQQEETSVINQAREESKPSASEEPTAPEKEEVDIRYVSVQSGYIRSEPDMDGEIISIANFGEAYLIEETIHDSANDIEWLKISGISSGNGGWISENIMQEVSETLNDAETAKKLQTLLGSHPLLEEISVMEEEQMDETTFEEEASDLAISVSNTSEEDVTEVLGEPQLLVENNLLYHGTAFDFIFTLDNGQVEELSIAVNKSNH